MPLKTEVLIIGGGLAGLTAAIHLQKLGFTVTLIEKQTYPHHKVCGEYISNEVLPYFRWLGINLENLAPTMISDLEFTSTLGKSIITKLPLGGFGLSRYAMDNFLYQNAISRGVIMINDTVSNVSFYENKFTVETVSGKSLIANHVIGAYGKRALLDVKLERNFISKKSPYLAVKAHYKSNFSNTLVSLNNFQGGYCGVSKVENNQLNICYLANYDSFKKHKNIQAFQENVLYKNSNLRKIFESSEMIFDVPLTISQISFKPKEPVFNHILMIGDTAGLINPLCGNGMAMAVHGAKILSELLEKKANGEIQSYTELENAYTSSWKKLFSNRLTMGRMLATLLSSEKLENIALNSIIKIPFILRKIIKHTHGQPITI